MCRHITRYASSKRIDDEACGVEGTSIVWVEHTHKWQAKNEEDKNKKLGSTANDCRKDTARQKNTRELVSMFATEARLQTTHLNNICLGILPGFTQVFNIVDIASLLPKIFTR